MYLEYVTIVIIDCVIRVGSTVEARQKRNSEVHAIINRTLMVKLVLHWREQAFGAGIHAVLLHSS